MNRRHLLVTLTFPLIMAALAWASLALLPDTAYYPRLVIDAGHGIRLDFRLNGLTDRASCQKLLESMRTPAAAKCPACGFEAGCDRHPDREAMGYGPISSVSLRLPAGVLLVHAPNPAEALQVCAGIGSPCIPPGRLRRP